jgi:hypothetical protein
MLQPHSFLWHYLWVAPKLLLGILAFLIWKRQLHRTFQIFFIYIIFEVVQWAILYPLDLIPTVPAENFWRAYWISSLVEALIIFALLSEIFAGVFGAYSALARFGKRLIRWAGGLLVIGATVTAAYAPIDNPHWLIPATHILQETVYIVECGLISLLFIFAHYFQLSWNRLLFGIALGLGICACVQLGTWAVMANGGLADKRHLLDMLNMATNHVSVLIWFYYLLTAEEVPTTSAAPLPEHNLELWNRELERLLQQ